MGKKTTVSAGEWGAAVQVPRASVSTFPVDPHPSFPGSLEPAQQINSISSQWLFQHVFFYLFDLP